MMKTQSQPHFATLLLLTTAALSGCASTPAAPEKQADIEAVTPRTEWIQALHEELSTDLCAEDQVFRSCYSISENDCHSKVRQAATICEQQYWSTLPDALNDAQSQQWGSRLGQCAGEGVFRMLDTSTPISETERCKTLLSEM